MMGKGACPYLTKVLGMLGFQHKTSKRDIFRDSDARARLVIAHISKMSEYGFLEEGETQQPGSRDRRAGERGQAGTEAGSG